VTLLAYALVIFGAMMRLMPHLPNFAPIAAVALFGAVYLKRSHALLLPIAALFVSDIFIGFDTWQSRLVVYGSFLLVGLIGLLVRRYKSFGSIVAGSLTGSVVFYLITNLVFLYPPTMYSHDLGGQLASYYNALPFFRNTLLGDLFFTGLLFGSYELIRAAINARRSAMNQRA
jgi:hypothetical protein